MCWFDHRNADTIRNHKRLKVVSYLATFGLTVVLVFGTDWSNLSPGRDHIFTNLKPKLKRIFNQSNREEEE